MKRRVLLASVLGAALLSSCASTPKPRTDIGMTKVGLSQAFTNTELEPLPPEVIVRLVPALTPEVVARGPLPPTVTVPLVNPCPEAAEDASVAKAAPIVIVGQPKPGFYKRHNVGTIKLTTGPISVQFPYPPSTYDEVRDVKVVETSPAPQLAPMPKTQYTVISNITAGYVVKDTFQYDASTLDLVRHEETNNGAVINDDWVPPVQVFDQTGLGKNWQDIGASTTSRRVYTVTGVTNQKKRVVDVCGTLVETIEARTTTRIADVARRTTSGTTTGRKDVLALATGDGGLAAYREIHTTDVVTIDNVPVTIETNVVSVLDSIKPLSERPA